MYVLGGQWRILLIKYLLPLRPPLGVVRVFEAEPHYNKVTPGIGMVTGGCILTGIILEDNEPYWTLLGGSSFVVSG